MHYKRTKPRKQATLTMFERTERGTEMWYRRGRKYKNKRKESDSHTHGERKKKILYKQKGYDTQELSQTEAGRKGRIKLHEGKPTEKNRRGNTAQTKTTVL